MSNIESLRSNILKSLKGQKVTLPDLDIIHRRWPKVIHPQLELLKKDIEDRVILFFPPGKRREQVLRAAPALWGATWYPYAPYDRLLISTCLGMWLFAFDDDLETRSDKPNVNFQVDNFVSLTDFVRQSKEFIHHCVMLNHLDLHKLPGCQQRVIANFEYISRRLCPYLTTGQKQLFLDELYFFIDMCTLERQVEESENLPSVENYIERRLGSTSDGIVFSIIEFCYDMELPPAIVRSEEIRRIWDSANHLIGLTNDVLSLQKEIASDNMDNIVPILFAKSGNLPTAIRETVDLITRYADEFDVLSKNLLDSHSSDSELQQNIDLYLRGLQHAISSNFYWGLQSPRYGLPEGAASGCELVLCSFDH